MRRIWLAFAIVALGAESAQAMGGFAVPEQGARAAGMANAFVAVADDPSAAWYNPAGLAFQKRGIVLGFDLIWPKVRYASAAGSYGMKRQTFFIPHHYVALPLGDHFAFGLAINAPFGLTTDWTGSGAPFSRVSAGADSITLSKIEVVQLNPSISYRVSDRLALAAGIAYYRANKVALDNALLQIHGSGDGLGGNLALFWRGDRLRFGLSYRSAVRLKISGSAIGLGTLPGLGGVVGGASTRISLPDLLNLGIAWELGPYTIALEAGWTNWKRFDRIVIDFAPSALNVATGRQKVVPENWKAVWDLRLGVNWRFDATTQARAGLSYQQTPVNGYDFSPRLPDANRYAFSIGYSKRLGAHAIDFAYLLVWTGSRTIAGNRVPAYDGSYKTTIQIVALDWRWNF